MTSIQEKTFLISLTYWLRNKLSKPLFTSLERNNGNVLDIGGGSFYKNLKENSFEKYFVLEPNYELLPKYDSKINNIIADGSKLPFKSNFFDTVLVIQVLQFIFEPNELIKEVRRVLKPNGKLILQVPQSGNLHGIPYHYYNFTRFWIEKILSIHNFEIERQYFLGGSWRTLSSRLFLMFWPVFKNEYYFDPKFEKRGLFFWITLPFQIIFSIVIFPITLFFSLFDIKEESNNHLVVAKKIILSLIAIFSLSFLESEFGQKYYNHSYKKIYEVS